MNSLEEEHEPTPGLDALNWPQLVERPRGEGTEAPSEELRPWARSRSRGQLMRTAAPVAVALVVLAALLVSCLRACGAGRARHQVGASPAPPPTADANELSSSGAGRDDGADASSGSHTTVVRRSRASDRPLRHTHLSVTAAVIERYPLDSGAAPHAGDPSRPRPWTLAAHHAGANVRAQLEFGFER